MNNRSLSYILLFCCFFLNCAAFAQDNLAGTVQHKLLPVMNQLRADAGLSPLTTDDSRLADSALLHVALFSSKETIADQYEGEASLAERLSSAKIASGAAGEIMFNIHNFDAPAEELFKSERAREVLLNPKFKKVGFAAVQSGRNTFVVIDLVQPLEVLPVEEFESRVIKSLQSARTKQNIRPFKVPEMKRLRTTSCDMAKKDSLKVPPVDPYLEYIGAPSDTFRSINYNTPDPGVIPSGVESMAGDPKLNSVSVGVCFGKSTTYPGGTYWVALLFYSK